MKKKLFSLALAVLMVFSLLPAVSAAEQGSLSDQITWSFDPGTATLTISGQGAIPDLSYPFTRPWDAVRDQIRHLVVDSGITGIGMYLFNSHTALSSVSLPAGLVTIGDLAFYGCTALTEVSLPEGLTTIGTSAFNESGLTHIEIPDSVTTLGNAVFGGCHALESVKLPAGLVRAQGGVFDDCINLKTVTMPQMPNLESFGAFFFRNCDSITDLSFYTAPFIDGNMFSDCSGLTDVVIPDCVVRMCQEDYCFAFQDCENLKCVTFPAGMEIVGDGTFGGNPSLTSVYFQGDAPIFGTRAFQNVTVTCYYPEGNPTWTEEVLQNYEGTVTWVPYKAVVNPFTDIVESDFYYDSVLWAVDNGITAGTGNGKFSPNDFCTRAQVVTFLWRAAGCPEPAATKNPFVDVTESDYFYKAVLWAVEKGITAGTGNGKFSPEDNCTRAQVVTFLHRSMGTPAPESQANPFRDLSAQEYYYNAVLWAVENGVTKGTSVDTFSPNAVCSRAQVVTFLYRVQQ